MGDAYTAIADDSSTLFYNPAALGRNNKVTLDIINPKFEVTNYLKYASKFKDFPSAPAAIADRVMGIPVYLSLEGVPTVKMKYFAFSFFASAKTSMSLENAIHPSLSVDYRLDRGFIAGVGFPISGKGKKGSNGHLTNIGFSVKAFNRQGLKGDYDLFGTELLEYLSDSANSDFDNLRESLGYSVGKTAIGFDLGFEQAFFSGSSSHVFGMSLMDIFNTNFKKQKGNKDIPRQDMNLNFGYAFSQDWTFLDYSLSADFHPALEPISFMSKVHLGVKLGLPILSVYAGWNGGYLSYGLTTDIFFMKLTAGIYGVEAGKTFKEREASRAIIALDLLSIDLDI